MVVSYSGIAFQILFFFPTFLVEFLKVQWKNLRDGMKRCLVKREHMARSGAAAHTLPCCKYFEQLKFIQDKIMNKETDSNIDLSLISPPSSSTMTVSSPHTSGNNPFPSSPSTTSINLAVTDKSFSPCSPENINPENMLKCKLSPEGSSSYNKKKVKEMTTANMDLRLLQTLQDMNQTTKSILDDGKNESVREPEVDDADTLFCKSIIPSLSALEPRKNSLAKIKIQELLYQLEFE